jgi:hypothetical protein
LEAQLGFLARCANRFANHLPTIFQGLGTCNVGERPALHPGASAWGDEDTTASHSKTIRSLIFLHDLGANLANGLV